MTAASSRIVVPIQGMTCSNCAARVEKHIKTVPGVGEVHVNAATDSASISGDFSLDAIISAVKDAGYTANAPDVPPVHDATAWRDLIIAAALTLPLLLQMIAMTIRPGMHMPAMMEFALATPVQFWIGWRFYRGAWKALSDRSANMDVLVAMGTSAAYGFSVYQILRHGNAASGHLYFEASAIVITLILFGKYLEARAKGAASEALRSILALRPKVAHVLRGDTETEIPIAQVQIGDIVAVRPGDRLPVDGTIQVGESDIDESIVTGEPLPVARRVGDAVVSGSINGTGFLHIRADKDGTDSTLMRIAHMVEAAQTGRAPIQRLVDRISAVFVPLVIALAIGTFAVWMFLGAGFEPALIAAVSVLVIACPCALGLATPTALVAGTGVAADHGILFKDIETLERAAQIDHVVFDKTGTLTEGKPHLADIIGFEREKEALLPLVAAAQAGSEHPIGRAIVAAADAPLRPATEFRAEIGKGISAIVDGHRILVGTQRFAAPDATAAQQDRASALVEEYGIVVWVSIDDTAAGLIALSDTLREDATAAIAALNARNITSTLLSGDSQQNVQRVGASLGIGAIYGEASPEEKVEIIKSARTSGDHVAMVGDGINDAPALAMADLGIAMGSGTDAAMESAGVTLLRTKPALVADALDIAQATSRMIRQNLFWAFLYNVICLPIAAMGLLSPVLAGAAMALSSVSVVANSLRLKWWRPRSE